MYLYGIWDCIQHVRITATNLVQTTVVFNMAVDTDTAEDAANYTLTDSDDNDVAISDASLSDDAMTVVLTHANMGQQGKASLKVEDVQDLTETEMADFTSEEMEYLDTTLPTVVDLTVVGNDTLKVTFSEPMTTATLETKANYSVDGGDLFISKVEAKNNNTEANIELYSDLDAGDVSVKVKAAVEDEAGFGVVQTTVSTTVAEDETAPTVVSYKEATPNGVTLVFDEEIEIADATKTNYYHTNSGNEIKDAIVDADLSSDGKELTLDFSTNNLPEGTAYVYILKDSVNDLWDNKNAQIMIKVEVTIDETKPAVDGDVDVKTETTAEINFTEDMLASEITDEANYTLLDKDGKEIDKIKSVTAKDADTALVTFTETLSGEYSIVLEDLEDLSDNVIDDVTLTFTVDDLTAPVFTDFSATLYNAGDADQFIVLNFGEEMNSEGTYSVLDDAKYTVGSYQMTDLVSDYSADIVLLNDGKSVKLEIPGKTNTTGTANGVDLDANDDIVLGRVADAAGNYTVAFSDTIDVVGQSYVTVSKVEATGLDTLEVTFDDLLSNFEIDDLAVLNNTTTPTTAEIIADRALATPVFTLELSKVSVDVNSDGNTVATITLAADLDYEADIAGGDVDVTVAVVGEASTNEYGETLKKEADGVDPTDIDVVADKIAPVLVDTDADGTVEDGEGLTIGNDDTFTLTFEENVTATNASLAASDLVVKADNDTLVAGVDYQITAIGSGSADIDFEFLGDYLGFDGDVTVELASTVNYIEDASGNNVAELDVEFVVANVPTMLTAVADDATTLTVTFSENVESAGTFVSADVAAQFAVTDTNSAGVAATAAVITDNVLTLTFPAGTFETGVDVDSLAYVSAGADQDERIVDANSNDLANATLGDAETTTDF